MGIYVMSVHFVGCPDFCRDENGYDCVGGIPRDCCFAYSPIPFSSSDVLYCRSICDGNDIDFDNICRQRGKLRPMVNTTSSHVSFFSQCVVVIHH